MKKILAIGDPHAKVSSVDEIKELFYFALFNIDQHNVDSVVILGDLLDNFDKTDVYGFLAATELLLGLSAKVPTYYVVGNHDLISNNQFMSDKHFFGSFKNLDPNRHRLTIVDSPIYVGDIAMCPYSYPGRFKEALELLPQHPFHWKNAALIFAHQEFKGASFGGSLVSTHGDDWDDSYPVVISGHIHERAWLKPNILYVGTPYQTSFAEDQNKSLTIIDRTSGQLKFIEIPSKVGLKQTIRLTPKQFLSEFDPQSISGNIKTRIEISGELLDVKEVKTSSVYKNSLGKVKFSFKITDNIKEKVGNKNQPFIEILTNAASALHPELSKILEEVIKNANKTN